MYSKKVLDDVFPKREGPATRGHVQLAGLEHGIVSCLRCPFSVRVVETQGLLAPGVEKTRLFNNSLTAAAGTRL